MQVVVGACGESSNTAIPTGTSGFTSSIASRPTRFAEPDAGSGCRWVLAGELKALAVPGGQRADPGRARRVAGEPSRRRTARLTGCTTGERPIRSAAGSRGTPGAIHHVIDQAVLAGLFGAHEAVAVGVFLEPLEGLPGVPLVDLR